MHLSLIYNKYCQGVGPKNNHILPIKDRTYRIQFYSPMLLSKRTVILSSDNHVPISIFTGFIHDSEIASDKPVASPLATSES